MRENRGGGKRRENVVREGSSPTFLNVPTPFGTVCRLLCARISMMLTPSTDVTTIVFMLASFIRRKQLNRYLYRSTEAMLLRSIGSSICPVSPVSLEL